MSIRQGRDLYSMAGAMGRSRISVICPSRLVAPASASRPELYVARAIRSVRWQSVWADFDWEIVVAVDPGRAGEVPAILGDVRVVEGDSLGQAAAVNAAVRTATGDVVAILEDDDVWHWRKIELQLGALREPTTARFASANQIEMDQDGGALRINDFATPSGWLMNRKTWEAVGPLNESFRWHVDNEWLGRLNAQGIPRVHLIEQSSAARELVATLVKRSGVRRTDEAFPLVFKEAHPAAATARIADDLSCRRQSRDEYRRMIADFGEVPW
jgi:glycosyltransferase involved in cell wall biosynthesis